MNNSSTHTAAIRSGWAIVVATLAAVILPECLGQAAPQTSPSRADSQQQLPPTTSNGLAPMASLAVERRSPREEVLENVSRVEQSVRQYQAQFPAKAVPEYLTEQLELYKWLDLLFSDHESMEARKTELQGELEQLRNQISELRNLGLTKVEAPSFLMLDDLLDQLAAEQARQESMKLQTETARAMLESARQQLEAGETQRRMAREALELAPDNGARERLSRDLVVAQLRSRVRGESVRQQQLELEVTELEEELSRTRTEFLAEETAQLRGKVQFSAQDLQSRIAMLDRAEGQFRQWLADIQVKSSQADAAWLDAKRQRDQRGGNDPLLNEAVTTRHLSRELLREQASLLKQVMGEMGMMRAIWRYRFDLASGQASAQQIDKWYAEVEKGREELDRFKQLIEIRADERRGDLATLQKRLLAIDGRQPELGAWLQQQVEELNNAVDAYGSHLVLIKAGQRMLTRVADELQHARTSNSAQQWLSQAVETLRATWRYEITSVDDRPVTVGKIVSGVILLLAGFLISRILSRLLGKQLLPRFGLNQGASVAFQSIAFYLLLVCFGFLSLELIHLPITIFAFLGGAVAIGVGFGSQNVLNNFISGLILLAERPIRVGDLVGIDGLNGTIEQIGARSTRVRTGSNLEIIVPNSKFLENNVTNWTLTDTRTRVLVEVGASYGSPTRQVTQLLHDSVSQHPHVLKTPEPIVLFKAFGDNSLNFQIHFWVHLRTIMQGEIIASEVRHTIDELFKQAGITIAFPQRDVHLDMSAPIEVNIRRMSDDLASGLRRAA